MLCNTAPVLDLKNTQRHLRGVVAALSLITDTSSPLEREDSRWSDARNEMTAAIAEIRDKAAEMLEHLPDQSAVLKIVSKYPSFDPLQSNCDSCEDMPIIHHPTFGPRCRECLAACNRHAEELAVAVALK